VVHAEKGEDGVRQTFQVIPRTLVDADVRRERSEFLGADEVVAHGKRNTMTLVEELGQAPVDDVQFAQLAVEPDADVGGLEVAMDDAPGVGELELRPVQNQKSDRLIRRQYWQLHESKLGAPRPVHSTQFDFDTG